jgi:hypothetical protein
MQGILLMSRSRIAGSIFCPEIITSHRIKNADNGVIIPATRSPVEEDQIVASTICFLKIQHLHKKDA